MSALFSASFERSWCVCDSSVLPSDSASLSASAASDRRVSACSFAAASSARACASSALIASSASPDSESAPNAGESGFVAPTTPASIQPAFAVARLASAPPPSFFATPAPPLPDTAGGAAAAEGCVLGAAWVADTAGGFLETTVSAALPVALPVASPGRSSSSFFSPSFLGVAICVMSLA